MAATQKNAPARSCSSGEGLDNPTNPVDEGAVTMQSTDEHNPQFIRQPPGWALRQAREECATFDKLAHELEQWILTRAHEIAAAEEGKPWPEPEEWMLSEVRGDLGPDATEEQVRDRATRLAGYLMREIEAKENEPDTLPIAPWADHVETEGYSDKGSPIWHAGANLYILKEDDLPVDVGLHEHFEFIEDTWVSEEGGIQVTLYGPNDIIYLRHPDDARALAAALSQAADRLAQIQAGAR